MVIIFDLDDTLYDDLLFVRGGLQAVAHYLAPLVQRPVEEIERGLNEELAVNRSEVFNRLLNKLGIHNKRLIVQCLSIYRRHSPRLTLYPEAEACLKRFQKFPLYIVTDGNKLVQKKKFLALGLDSRVKKCLCTHAYGIRHSKPSPHCFLKVCALENVSPQQVVYIADNPKKDFVGIKPLGFHTIRVLTGPHRHLIVPPEYEAEMIIHSLEELTEEKIHNLR